MQNNKYRFETLQVHAGQKVPGCNSTSLPIFQTAAYVFDDCADADAIFSLSKEGDIYSRLTNPTQSALETRITALEGGKASLALASGAAAVAYSLLNVLQAGDHIVAANNLYGGTFNFITHTLASLGIDYTIVDMRDTEALSNAIKPNTKVVYAETFGNPNSDVTDLDKVSKIAHEHGAMFIVDNTFGTPYLIRPIEHGADVVVHSATKFLGGHGTSLGGIIVDSGNFEFKSNADRFPTICSPDPNYHGGIFAEMAPEAPFVTRVRCVLLRDQGACISPFNSFLLMQGIETLSLRVERHVANAMKVVDFLAKHPKVKSVSHPSLPQHPDHRLYETYFPNGGGSIFTFDLDGGRDAAWRFIDALEVFSLVANVADVKSLVIHPATTTHSQLTEQELEEQNIHPGTIRLSIGIENADDLIADLAQALEKV